MISRKTRPRASKTASRRLQEPPRRLQRPPRGPQEPPERPPKPPRGVQRGSIRSVILDVFRSWGFLKPFWRYLGALRPPRRLQDAFKGLQDASNMPPRRPQGASKSLQEAPRRLQDAACCAWPSTKGGLAVVRPRRASSIRQTTFVERACSKWCIIPLLVRS